MTERIGQNQYSSGDGPYFVPRLKDNLAHLTGDCIIHTFRRETRNENHGDRRAGPIYTNMRPKCQSGHS